MPDVMCRKYLMNDSVIILENLYDKIEKSVTVVMCLLIAIMFFFSIKNSKVIYFCFIMK